MRKTILGALLLAVGCDAITGPCTLLPCFEGLTVRFIAVPTTPYRVEVMSLRGGGPVTPKYVFECGDPATCGAPFFPDFFPTEVAITVVLPTRSVTVTRVPAYAKSEPNGKGCGTCRVASVTVQP